MTDRDKLIEELREFFTYIDEDRQDIITKAIAALSVPAKPEPAEAKPLPESVVGWVTANCEQVSDYSKKLWIDTDTIRNYLTTLTAAHQAELAAKEAEIAELRHEVEVDDLAMQLQQDILDRICATLKGPKPEGKLQSWHDLPDLVAELKDELSYHTREGKRLNTCIAGMNAAYAKLVEEYHQAEAKGRRVL